MDAFVRLSQDGSAQLELRPKNFATKKSTTADDINFVFPAGPSDPGHEAIERRIAELSSVSRPTAAAVMDAMQNGSLPCDPTRLSMRAKRINDFLTEIQKDQNLTPIGLNGGWSAAAHDSLKRKLSTPMQTRKKKSPAIADGSLEQEASAADSSENYVTLKVHEELQAEYDHALSELEGARLENAELKSRINDLTKDCQIFEQKQYQLECRIESLQRVEHHTEICNNDDAADVNSESSSSSSS